MRTFIFQITWGEWSLYSSEKYHEEYDFSGHIETEKARIIKTERMQFPKMVAGPYVHSPIYSEMEESRWTSVVRRWFDGVRVTAEAEDTDLFRVVTASVSLAFTAGELEKKKLIAVPVGDKYSMAQIIVEIDDFSWAQAPMQENEIRLPGSAFEGRQDDFFRARGVVLAPGEKTRIDFTAFVPEKEEETDELSV